MVTSYLNLMDEKKGFIVGLIRIKEIVSLWIRFGKKGRVSLLGLRKS